MHEECGVFGVYSEETHDVASTVYYGLYALQHRGQESCGIAVAYANKIEYYKGMGLFPTSFRSIPCRNCPKGTSRSATSGIRRRAPACSSNAQPIVFTGKCGKMALAHNGNLTQYRRTPRQTHRRQRRVSDDDRFRSHGDADKQVFGRGHRARRTARLRAFQGLVRAGRDDGRPS